MKMCVDVLQVAGNSSKEGLIASRTQQQQLAHHLNIAVAVTNSEDPLSIYQKWTCVLVVIVARIVTSQGCLHRIWVLMEDVAVIGSTGVEKTASAVDHPTSLTLTRTRGVVIRLTVVIDTSTINSRMSSGDRWVWDPNTAVIHPPHGRSYRVSSDLAPPPLPVTSRDHGHPTPMLVGRPGTHPRISSSDHRRRKWNRWEEVLGWRTHVTLCCLTDIITAAVGWCRRLVLLVGKEELNQPAKEVSWLFDMCSVSVYLIFLNLILRGIEYGLLSNNIVLRQHCACRFHSDLKWVEILEIQLQTSINTLFKKC